MQYCLRKKNILVRARTGQPIKIKKGCEGDIMKVNARLTDLEKKMWTMAGGLAVVSLLFSAVGNKLITSLLSPTHSPIPMERTIK